jgi:hypothetical protein
MASPKTKSRSSKKKSYRLTDSDLALAATASADRRKSIIKAAVGGSGYDYYRGIKTNLGAILNLAGASLGSLEQIKVAVALDCIGPREIKPNQSVAEGLREYVAEHNVEAAAFDYPPVALGLAGLRDFWAPLLLKIDGKKYIPFFDFRQGPRRLPREAWRFIFSIQHSHIRQANPTEFGDVGLVVFQFTAPISKVRKVVPHFDTGVSFWSDKDIGAMIDAVYRDLNEIKKAA